MSTNSIRRIVSVGLFMAPFLVITSVAWIGRATVASTPSPLVLTGAVTQNKKMPPKRTRPRQDCSQVADATLVARVKDALSKTRSLRGLEIGVEVKDGVVTLTGTRVSRRKRRTAGRVARGVSCVKHVVNLLECGTLEKPCGDECIPRNAPCGKRVECGPGEKPCGDECIPRNAVCPQKKKKK